MSDIIIHQNYNDNEIEMLASNMTSSSLKMEFLNEFNFCGSGFTNKEDIDNFIKSNRQHIWLIKEKSTNNNVGFLGLINNILSSRQLVIYMDKDYAGKKYSSESIQLLLLVLPNVISGPISLGIEALTHVNNTIAQKILLKNDFTLKNTGSLINTYIRTIEIP